MATSPPVTSSPSDILTIARLVRVLERQGGDELSLAQLRTLGLLMRGDERATELARRLAVPKPTMTAVVNSLVVKGYVAREGSREDRRVVRLSITPAGREAHDRAAALLCTALDDLLARCPDPAGVLAALEQLRVALDHRLDERMARRSPPGGEPASPAPTAGTAARP